MKLADIQRGFTAYIRGDGQDELAIVAPQSLRGLPVYHYAYRASLVEALRDVFERTHSWLGDENFDNAARTHIAVNPPNSWTMSDYGLGFEETLDSLYPDNPEVAELAWIDWSLRIAFNGPDAPPLDLAGLAEVDWDAARLHLAPTLVIRPVRTNCAALWGALTDDNPEPPTAEISAHPVVLTVWRHDLMPRFHSVTDEEHEALLMAQNGLSFGAICARLGESDDDEAAVAERAGAMLGRWISEGVLVAVS
jgi:Putative DNA-binding domain